MVKVIKVTVLVAIRQEAAFRRVIPRPPRCHATMPPRGGREKDPFDMALYVSRGKIPALPCTTDTKGARTRRRGKKKLQSLVRGGMGSA